MFYFGERIGGDIVEAEENGLMAAGATDLGEENEDEGEKEGSLEA